MANKYVTKPIGVILQQAGLVSEAQIEVALRDQSQYEHLRLGEILALRGWLKSETADFFAEQLPRLTNLNKKQLLGQYLKEAALLDENQIKIILDLQKQTGLRFGSLVVRNGWLKQSTIDFFVSYQIPQLKSDSKGMKKGSIIRESWEIKSKNNKPSERKLNEDRVKKHNFTSTQIDLEVKKSLKTTFLSKETELNPQNRENDRSLLNKGKNISQTISVIDKTESLCEEIKWID
jgi:hypothetical protein